MKSAHDKTLDFIMIKHRNLLFPFAYLILQVSHKTLQLTFLCRLRTCSKMCSYFCSPVTKISFPIILNLHEKLYKNFTLYRFLDKQPDPSKCLYLQTSKWAEIVTFPQQSFLSLCFIQSINQIKYINHLKYNIYRYILHSLYICSHTYLLINKS